CFSSQRDYCTDFWICKNARLFIAYKTDFKKQKQRGKMTCPSKILLRYFWLVKTLHQFYDATILDLIFALYDIAVNFKKNKKQRRFKK
ncbi:hypothetical protein D3Z53_17195, partial [Lachnospiraceae bacterium]|nr:hypothetical protein [Lachnospiraceae bacterium]